MLKALKKINLLLSILVICTSFYLLFIFLWPEINLQIVKAYDSTNGYVYKSELALEQENIKKENLKDIPLENRLVIPKIRVNGIIREGETKKTLDSGIWRRPNTNTAKEGGNMVLTSHRFLQNSGPNTFYHLDKLEIGDDLIVFWEGEEYIYKVKEIFEVSPDQIYIEENSDEDVITLYTCTPLFTAEKRLVVRGERK